VEDDPQLLPGFKRTLSEEGYEVFAVNNGNSALELLRRKTFNLILTDIVMEGINGLELLKEVRKLSPCTPVILITGFSSLKNAEEAIKFNATDYLVKPCEKKELKRRVSLALEKAKMEESMRISNCLESTQDFLELFANYFEIPLDNIMHYARLLSSNLLNSKCEEENYSMIHTGRQIEYWLRRMTETIEDMKNFNKCFEKTQYDSDYLNLIEMFKASKSDGDDDSGVELR
jgi:YesN/AraC family two-component response regulator